MKISRSFAQKIHFILDQVLPPFIRDSRFIMKFGLRLLHGKNASVFMSFKKKAPFLSEEQFAAVYERFQDNPIERETDLNKECFDEILSSLTGKNVLEVGSGRCLLSDAIQKKGYSVTATDIVIGADLREKYSKLTFAEGNVENLPFEDDSFDTVVCTHTLEHVQDLPKAISELRRVCRQRLLIVVPQQRPYKYTFDLHLHFFPYPSSLVLQMGGVQGSVCKVLGGDLFYLEDIEDKKNIV